jgi:hypothetical protein
MPKHSIVLAGIELALSPLNLGDLRRLEPALLGTAQTAESGLASMLALVPVIHASISKLHPEIAMEELEKMLDLNVFPDVLNRVLEISGLARKATADGSGRPE